jgi:N6-L-threonylcarbamoyladenine synthase
LIVSGGNTQLVFSRSTISHHILGLTLDDAVGEALDKTARLLNCNWSESGGLGRELEKMASKGNPLELNINTLGNYKDPLSFSFSGLKTALKSYISDKNNVTISQEDLAATIQEALFGHLLDRVENCFKLVHNCNLDIKTFSLIGGVASNHYLRNSLENLCKKFDVTLIAPEPSLCTDNAIMVGIAANMAFSAPSGQSKNSAPNRINPEWNIEELIIDKSILE